MTEVLRKGARQLLAYAVEAEVSAFIAAHGDLHDVNGRRRIVRHGYLPEREIQTGSGEVSVRCPRARDRGGALGAEKIGFSSAILPRYLRSSGAASWSAGSGVTYGSSAISTSGPTACTSSRAWRMTSNASWSSSAPMRRAGQPGKWRVSASAPSIASAKKTGLIRGPLPRDP